jgi:hypothetical protein
MSRNLNRRGLFSPAPVREPVVFPLVAPVYHRYEEYDRPANRPLGSGLLVRDRSFAPYQNGDLLFFLHNGEIKLGRVYTIFSKYQSFRGYYIPQFRVQFVTKDGHWSNNWLDVWPGAIYDAYFIDRDEDRRRTLPATIESLAQLRDIAAMGLL